MTDLARSSSDYQNGKVLVSHDIFWKYEKPEYMSKHLMLTIGGIAVIGTWYGNVGEHYKAHYLLSSIAWINDEPPDTSTKMLIKTVGGVSIIGRWFGKLGEHFTSYAYLPKRDKVFELKSGLL